MSDPSPADLAPLPVPGAPRTLGARLRTPLSPESRQRARIYLALIPLVLWALLAWTTYAIDIGVSGRLDRSGHIKGHDFLHFYVLGQIGADRATADLYDFDAQSARIDRLVPEYPARFLPVHTPQVAMFFAPLSRLPYPQAITLWIALSTALYGACAWLLWREFPVLRAWPGAAVVVAVGAPAFHALLTSGQTSAFALAWFTAALLAFRRGHEGWAGLALGMLVYKPTFGLLLPVAGLVRKQYRFLAGATAAVTLQFALAWAWFGGTSLTAFVANLGTAIEARPLLEAQPHAMHSLLAFFALLPVPASVAHAAYLGSAGLVAILALRIWRGPAPVEARFAALLLASVLVSPHFYAYDLVVLLPAWVCLFGLAAPAPWHGRLVALTRVAYLLPALDAVTTRTRIQPSVIVMTLTILAIYKAFRVSGR